MTARTRPWPTMPPPSPVLLAEFNAGVAKARREYEEHPFIRGCPRWHVCDWRKGLR